MTEASRLAALVDGSPLAPDAARALWTEFSAHMDEHQGDMAGFATKKGWISVIPEFQQGKAVLVVRTGAAMTVTAPKAMPRPAPQKKGPPPPKKKGPAQAKKGPPPKKGAKPQGKKPAPPAKKGPAPQAKRKP